MKYVIIGSGFAGLWAIDGIREIDKNNPITLISQEEAYSRPLISYYLGARVTADRMLYRNETFFMNNKVEFRQGVKVKKLEVMQKIVILENNEQVNYDKLLIATGGTPIFPPIKGKESKGVFTFTTFKDAQLIKQYIQDNKVTSVVVLGGGLIGLKATEALMDLHIKVTVVELADRILSATFDRKASGMIENALKQANCDVITKDTIDNIVNANNRVTGVELKSKKQLECQMVIVAIGVKPNLDLVKDTPIKVNRGIIVNQYLQTNINDVYAAGDVAEFEGWVIAILPIATRHGRIAGMNMAGKNKIYEGGTPKNAIELGGIPTISVGLTDPKENINEYEILEKINTRENSYRKIVLKDNIIVGAIFVNDIDRAGIFTGLIRDRVDVKSFKDNILKDDFGLVSLPRDYRKKTLIEGPVFEI